MFNQQPQIVTCKTNSTELQNIIWKILLHRATRETIYSFALCATPFISRHLYHPRYPRFPRHFIAPLRNFCRSRAMEVFIWQKISVLKLPFASARLLRAPFDNSLLCLNQPASLARGQLSFSARRYFTTHFAVHSCTVEWIFARNIPSIFLSLLLNWTLVSNAVHSPLSEL